MPFPVVFNLAGMALTSNANHRGDHWSSFHARSSPQRGLTMIQASARLCSAGPRDSWPLRLLVTIVRYSSGNKMDSDNLSGACKHVRDGISDALGIDDRDDERLVWRYGQVRLSKGQSPFVAVEIAERGACPCCKQDVSMDVERKLKEEWIE